MQVTKYLFESPSPNPVQVGRVDPSSVKEEPNASLPDAALNKSASEAKSFASTQSSEIKPSVESNRIDLYA